MPEMRLCLCEIACLKPDGRSWPARILFTFAIRAGDEQAVRFAGPRWLAGSECLRPEPPELLFQGPEASLALAVCGDDFGRDAGPGDNPVNRTLAAAVIGDRLSVSAPPGKAGGAWEAGLAAIDVGLAALPLPARRRRIFSFSKVYAPLAESRHLVLSHSVPDASGDIASRFRLALFLELASAPPPSGTPLLPKAELG